MENLLGIIASPMLEIANISTQFNNIRRAGMQNSAQDQEDESRGITTSALYAFRISVRFILLMFTGLNNEFSSQYKWYDLNLNENLQMILYVNAIRLNASVGSVVMDAAIAIVNDTNRRDILEFYNPIVRKGKTVSITVADNEWILWKSMILVLNERCRSGWKHDENCEYNTCDDNISLSLSSSLSSLSFSSTMQQQSQQHGTICKSHEGTDFESHYSNNTTNVFPNFIRIALSPLFPLEELTYSNNSSSSSQNETEATPTANSHISLASAISPSSSSSRSEIRPASSSANSLVKDQNVHNSCGHCEKSVVKLSQCGRCKQISYCGRECQVAHWKIHKKDCTKIRESCDITSWSQMTLFFSIVRKTCHETKSTRSKIRTRPLPPPLNDFSLKSSRIAPKLRPSTSQPMQDAPPIHNSAYKLT
eukprot:gene541-1034_t